MNNSIILNSSILTPILITGGCGFIGLNLVSFLLKKGYSNIRILDNLSVGTQESLESLLSEHGKFTKRENNHQTIYSLILNPDIPLNPEANPLILTLIVGDIRDKKTCLKATEGIDSVIHLAAHAGVDPFHRVSLL